MPAARALLALVAMLVPVPAGTASASFDGSNGKVAYVGTDDGLYLDDPWDDQPAQGPLATVASKAVEDMLTAAAHPPAWSPDGTMVAYTAPVPDTFGRKHSAVFVMKADGSDAHQVSHPFALKANSCGSCDDGQRAGRQARVKVRVSKAARRALRRGALRAVATLSVRGTAGAAAASAKLRLR
jgi:hypothetical protein